MKLDSQRIGSQNVSPACWCTSCTGCSHGCISDACSNACRGCHTGCQGGKVEVHP
ncbi:TPA: hypothetical protein ACXDAZ_001818 [Clostridium botulinum]|uniref:Keratin associated protein 5-5 n=1 Tax=Clostridium botulinum CFSAN001627 TaxID=1232189 RepID=M1ZX48_CLOBO|nr:hypothetical protein [Clostridium botulinum]EKN41605.1 keratin associated protein 5-5 [Clostridium botulinum CFSAN001627]APC80076.1 putative keratin associated protein 5-5 [Clostridium botulinum]APC85156.1 putative keratin associated protein 5-5 [Clostridium botulinum]APH21087.1 putative keratin associated protein 5-5 [Clostridium botulinum]APQ69587.1 putative keratin associated protein 5-5 [Clostridium botulinum]